MVRDDITRKAYTTLISGIWAACEVAGAKVTTEAEDNVARINCKLRDGSEIDVKYYIRYEYEGKATARIKTENTETEVVMDSGIHTIGPVGKKMIIVTGLPTGQVFKSGATINMSAGIHTKNTHIRIHLPLRKKPEEIDQEEIERKARELVEEAMD